MKAPRTLTEAFEHLDEEDLLSFAIDTPSFFPGWPAGTEAVREAFDRLDTLRGRIQRLTDDGDDELSAEDMALFNRKQIERDVSAVREGVTGAAAAGTYAPAASRETGAEEASERVLRYLRMIEEALPRLSLITVPAWKAAFAGAADARPGVVLFGREHVPSGEDIEIHPEADYDERGALQQLSIERDGVRYHLELVPGRLKAEFVEHDQFSAPALRLAGDTEVDFFDWVMGRIAQIGVIARAAEEKEVRCSFCGKHQDEAGRLIAGRSAFICEECVEVCHEIVRVPE